METKNKKICNRINDFILKHFLLASNTDACKRTFFPIPVNILSVNVHFGTRKCESVCLLTTI